MRILAALSGGVDSAVAAARLRREGAEVIGVHLRTGVEAEDASAAGNRSCCGADDARDARLVATKLGLAFYVVDVADVFAGVLDSFVAAYAAGQTPNPCIDCNRDVKFGRLREIALELGCEAVATGHYARRERGGDGRWRLLRARDPQKDQSYVLYPLDQQQLAQARFPLGEDTKDRVRDEAATLGLSVAAKPDSQDLCFAPHGDYRRLLAQRAPDAMVAGEIVDRASGRAIGRHEGAAGYTVGQRRGLPAVGSPRYVAHVDPQAGRVEVATRDALLRDEVEVMRVNWIEIAAPGPAFVERVQARVRHAGRLEPADLEVDAAGGVRVCFSPPVFAPTPGQALVAYRGEAVLCGGTIQWPARTHAPDAETTRAPRP